MSRPASPTSEHQPGEQGQTSAATETADGGSEPRPVRPRRRSRGRGRASRSAAQGLNASTQGTAAASDSPNVAESPNVTAQGRRPDRAGRAPREPRPVRELTPVHPTYDPALPIAARHADIATAIRENQVVVIAGETGSGKTTQLPKICLELGRRSIGHTQPRRIAARTVAERIAEELKTDLGDLVGYQVRFTRKAGRDTRLKVMTDGVLLAEIGHDRDLRRYDTIIIDEAHERSLNIDFLLGYLRQLIMRRPDLKIIITSATIDTERFATHFADAQGNPAPIIEVSGRTFPVEIRYRPLGDPDAGGVDSADQIDGITAAVKELAAQGDGDILIFLSGEREIRDAAEAINGLRLRFTEVLPLYARLSAADQHKVFAAHSGRRVVLATNVAETSLTVPGIRYVIDAGLARISRYSARTKVQRLPIEPISQASANQRSGRCGRVAPGVAIRLYSEEDFVGRPEFTEPEILRTNLASVILQMTAADLGDISTFPFVEAPDSSQIADGLRLLEELGAIKEKGSKDRPVLTAVGRDLAAIPVDPRMGRMLLAGAKQGCLREMMIIVAGLSIPDPRERPPELQEKAAAMHRRFWAPLAGPGQAQAAAEDRSANHFAVRSAQRSGEPEIESDGSDFIALLRLWDYLRDAQKRLSGNAFRRMCRDEFLHFLRIREWQDLHTQLKDIAKDLGLNRNEQPAGPDRVHTAALSGLLSHVGLADLKDEPKTPVPARKRGRQGPREYLGARGSRFAINPGSSVAKTQPPLVVAAEIVETTRLWARTVAGITAEQVEEVGEHLLKRHYSEPHWSARSGAVMAYEQVSLYGIPIIAQRRVPYTRVNPAEAREIFIRSALVEGDWQTRHHFFRDNAALRVEIEALEERTRRRDIVVDDETIFAYYHRRIPAEVSSGAHFDAWWKDTRHVTPDLLTMTMDDLASAAAGTVRVDDFPDTWIVGEHELAVTYQFDPGSSRDGVTVTVPVAVLNQLEPAAFTWQVPGLRNELAAALIRSLPKAIRRQFVPAPDFAVRALGWLADHPQPDNIALPAALGIALRGLTGELVPADAWRYDETPGHLRVTLVVTSGSGTQVKTLGEGKSLDELKEQLAGQVSQTLNAAAARLTHSGATDWVFGTIDAEISVSRHGHKVVGYPALVDEGSSAGLAVVDTAERQFTSHPLGLRRLVLLNTPDPTRWVVGHLSNTAKLALGGSPYASVPALLADARLASVGELTRRVSAQLGAELVRDEATFRRVCDLVRADNADLARAVVDLAAEVVGLQGQVLTAVSRLESTAPNAAADLREQLDNLIFAGFLAATPYEHLVDLPRYLRAAMMRVTTLQSAPARDRQGFTTISRCEDAYAELCAAAPAGRLPVFVEDVGWLLEELRVSLFAQGLRTKVPVSEKRVINAIADARSKL